MTTRQLYTTHLVSGNTASAP